jgi:hypothetical protein
VRFWPTFTLLTDYKVSVRDALSAYLGIYTLFHSLLDCIAEPKSTFRILKPVLCLVWQKIKDLERLLAQVARGHAANSTTMFVRAYHLPQLYLGSGSKKPIFGRLHLFIL